MDGGAVGAVGCDRHPASWRHHCARVRRAQRPFTGFRVSRVGPLRALTHASKWFRWSDWSHQQKMAEKIQCLVTRSNIIVPTSRKKIKTNRTDGRDDCVTLAASFSCLLVPPACLLAVVRIQKHVASSAICMRARVVRHDVHLALHTTCAIQMPALLVFSA